ncbi:MAG: metallophosphoesterase [Methanobrevibacter sp.]|nr:metallophosphoesterase [Methanobrevibacter sp.]
MSFRTRRVIFMTPFLMLYEFFLLKYLFLLFGGIDDIYIGILTILFGFLHIVPMLFEEKKSICLTRALDEICGIWIWASLFILFDLIIIYFIASFVKVPMWFILLSLIVIFIIGVYSYYKAHKLVVNDKEIYLDVLSEDVNIVHFSDVHFGSIRHKKIINDLRDKLIELSDDCDIAIISGDLADGSCVVEEDDFLPLKDVDMPIVFVPGNHDYYPGIDNVIKACRNADIIVLDNESMEFKGMNIFGLTFSFGDIEMPSADDLISTIKEDGANIVIYHVPQGWQELSSLGFDIQLSGHTHGGQFYPVVWIGDRIWYNRGLFKAIIGGKDKYLHVTTGVGGMDYPFRWGTDSELVVLKLRKKN